MTEKKGVRKIRCILLYFVKYSATLAVMIVGTVRLDTVADDQGQFPLARQDSHAAMAVIGHQQRLATLLAVLFCGALGRGVRRAMPLLLLGLSACFSFQATPAVNPSLPFSPFSYRAY
jgi:hypothetical protein